MTVVAIDGPAGAGKSTVARAVAARLGFRYLDTGALYRAVTAAVLERGVSPDDAAGCAAVAEAARIDWRAGRVWLDGRDVTARIRSTDVTDAVSAVARQPAVRAALVPVQRRLAAGGRIVIEGRDIAATIAPDADVKVFLTASAGERARRRSIDLGIDERDHSRIQATLEARDRADSTRASSPLAQVPDAVVLDSTGMDLTAVVGEIVALVGRDDAAPPADGSARG